MENLDRLQLAACVLLLGTAKRERERWGRVRVVGVSPGELLQRRGTEDERVLSVDLSSSSTPVPHSGMGGADLWS